MLRRWTALSRGIRWLTGIAAAVLALAVVWALFVPLADWLARHDVGSGHGTLHQAALDNARGRLLTLTAGLLAAGALAFTARTFYLSREGQVTDRYTKAIEQLGSKELDVRIGGIYALERIARDSARDHPVVMEVLTAFIREHSHEPWSPPRSDDEEPERSTRPDVQAGLTVAGRRDVKRDVRTIDLARAKLTGADLAGADLAGACLTGACLTGANLFHANLTDANLTEANLARANLTGAGVCGADLTGAHLTRAGRAGTSAYLAYADLRGADLTGASITTRVNLRGARLGGARWPAEAPVPEGWELDAGSGQLQQAGTGPGPAEED